MGHLAAGRRALSAVGRATSGRLFAVDVGETDIRPLVQQRLADGTADTLCGTGHDAGSSRRHASWRPLPI